ncbi:pentatricopeptide repeat domain-containing protein [Diplocarpon mali]|nr:pentatricopeptide repeat domain-containing protein [Diplocarpon mali]
MSPGIRIAKRSKAVILASSTSTPKEPLLFLYPRWIRQSSSASPTASPDDANFKPVIQAKKSAFIPKPPHGSRDDPAVWDKRFNSKAAANSDAPVLRGTPPPTQARPSDITTDDGTSASEEIQQDLMGRTSSEEMIKKTSSKYETFLKRMSHHSLRQEMAQRLRMAHSERKSAKFRNSTARWRAILEFLTKNTPDQENWPSKSLKLEVPSSVAHRIMNGIDDHFLELGDQNECLMELGDRDVNTLQYRTFVMSGSATSIIKCAAEILQIASDVRISATESRLPNEGKEQIPDMENPQPGQVMCADIRNVMTDKRGRPKMPPEQISKPEKWTQHSFLEYVTKLTSCDVTSHVNRYGFGSEESLQDAVTRLLREVFRDPSCRHVITRAACHVALEHFVSSNFIKDARMLFVRMEIMKLEITPRTFNTMLARCAKHNDLNSFHFIVNLMQRRGIVPNGNTWSHFLDAVVDVRRKMHIVNVMRKKGLLNHIRTLRATVFNLVQSEVESSLSPNQNLATFIAHMDSYYGPAWLSMKSANRVLKTLGAHGLFSRCWEFFQFMESRNFKPDHFSINIVLHYCKEAINLTGAVELLRSLPCSMEHMGSAASTAETYRIMFALAWRARSYNVAKVVWRYACLAGATSFRMRNRVFRSMIDSNRVEEPMTSRHKWLRFAGPFIIGLRDLSEHPSGILEEKLATFRKVAEKPEPLLPVTEDGIEIAKREQISLPADLLTELTENLVSDAPRATQTEKSGVLHTLLSKGPADDMEVTRVRQDREKVDMRGQYTSAADDSLARKLQTPDLEVATESEHGDIGSLKVGPTSSPGESKAESTSNPPSVGTDSQSPTSEHFTTPSPVAQHPPLALTPPQLNDIIKNRPQIRAPWAPTTIGKRTPAYKVAILKEYLNADLEISKDWQPERPFEVLLVEALRKDDRWKATEGYRGWGLEEMLDGRAIRIGLRSRKGDGNVWWR